MEQKPGIEKNTLLAIILCAGIWFAWQNYLEKKYPEMNKPKAEQTVQADQPVGSTGAAATNNPASDLRNTKQSGNESSAAKPSKPEQSWVYEDSLWKVTVSSY